MTRLDELRKELADKQAELAKKQAEIGGFEVEVDEDDYDAFIDEIYPPCECGVVINASEVLKTCDPIAYRCGMNDYADGLDKEDDPAYQELIEERDDIADLENDIEELEAEEEEE